MHGTSSLSPLCRSQGASHPLLHLCFVYTIGQQHCLFFKQHLSQHLRALGAWADHLQTRCRCSERCLSSLRTRPPWCISLEPLSWSCVWGLSLPDSLWLGILQWLWKDTKAEARQIFKGIAYQRKSGQEAPEGSRKGRFEAEDGGWLLWRGSQALISWHGRDKEEKKVSNSETDAPCLLFKACSSKLRDHGILTFLPGTHQTLQRLMGLIMFV